MKSRSKPYKTFRDGRLWLNLKTVEGRRLYGKALHDAWLRDGCRCGICGLYVFLDEATVDHIKPKGYAGAFHDDRTENIQPAHFQCNMLKGSKRNFHIEAKCQ